MNDQPPPLDDDISPYPEAQLDGQVTPGGVADPHIIPGSPAVGTGLTPYAWPQSPAPVAFNDFELIDPILLQEPPASAPMEEELKTDLAANVSPPPSSSTHISNADNNCINYYHVDNCSNPNCSCLHTYCQFDNNEHKPATSTTSTPSQIVNLRPGTRCPTCQRVSPKPKKLSCPLCPCAYADSRQLNRHLWVKHVEFARETKVPSENRPCRASGCDFIGRGDNVARHERRVHRLL